MKKKNAGRVWVGSIEERNLQIAHSRSRKMETKQAKKKGREKHKNSNNKNEKSQRITNDTTTEEKLNRFYEQRKKKKKKKKSSQAFSIYVIRLLDQMQARYREWA